MTSLTRSQIMRINHRRPGAAYGAMLRIAALAAVLHLHPSAAAGATQSITVGPVSLSAPDPVAMSPLENSTNFEITAVNTSPQSVTLEFTSWAEIRSGKPAWITHIYKFFGLEPPGQVAAIALAGGETRALRFFVSKDGGLPPQQASLPFRFRVAGTTGTLSLTVSADARTPELLQTGTAQITGIVTSATGVPIPNAVVTAALFNETARASAKTGADGRYLLKVLSTEQIAAALTSRPLPYASTSYWVTVDATGYKLAYQSGLAPAQNAVGTADFALTPLVAKTDYRLAAEVVTNGLLSYWWIRFAGSGDRLVAIQGQHDAGPEPGHVIALNLAGQELWRFATGSQCWGLDVSPDGQTIAVGCHDAFLYVLGLDGQLRYKAELGTRPGFRHVLDVRFSPDGSRLLVDGGGDARGFSVLDAATGARLWRAGVPAGEEPQGAYEARWSPDGQRIVAGDLGLLSMYTADGVLLWRQQLGESPLWLEIDSAYNVYAAGKHRELIKFDAQGNRTWTYRLAHTSNASTRPMSSDAKFMVVHTFNGINQAFDAAGTLLWQRFLPAQLVTRQDGSVGEFIYGPGHNALAMTPSGALHAVGTRGYGLVLYDRDGSRVWEHAATHRSSFTGPDPRVGSSYPGTNAVAISPDGRYIAAGYADSVIRIFERRPGVTAAPAALTFSVVRKPGGIAYVTPAQTVTLAQQESGSFSWQASSNKSWLSLSLSSAHGSGAGSFPVSIDGTPDLPASGVATGTITVTLTGASTETVTIPVSVTVYAEPAAATAPFGQVDTPAQNASGVVGAIGVTGWAMDDVGVAGVKIYRNCLPFEPPANCQSILGHSVVFVGDAAFLSGARPDVESAFPNHPQAYNAGWGYLMMTSMLPDVTAQQPYGGQGPLTLYAFATDVEGNVTLLGRNQNDHTPTSITMANDSIAKPFGAIDTPGQGQTVSGLVHNFGWALTPDSDTVAGSGDILIPTSGSTMFVFIDGAPVATVAYNQCRGTVGNPVPAGVFCNDDVANIFGNTVPKAALSARTNNPTRHRNLDAGRAAIGVYSIDTTKLSNGLHTIAWSVTDSANRTEGIGSRFFNVLNTSSDTVAAAQQIQARTPVIHGRTAPEIGPESEPAKATLYPVLSYRTGFDLAAPFMAAAPDANGVYHVALRELDRLELRIPSVDAAYLLVGDELRDLPTGAALKGDRVTWNPPAGYVGSYRLRLTRAGGPLVIEVTIGNRRP